MLSAQEPYHRDHALVVGVYRASKKKMLGTHQSGSGAWCCGASSTSTRLLMLTDNCCCCCCCCGAAAATIPTAIAMHPPAATLIIIPMTRPASGRRRRRGGGRRRRHDRHSCYDTVSSVVGATDIFRYTRFSMNWHGLADAVLTVKKAVALKG